MEVDVAHAVPAPDHRRRREQQIVVEGWKAAVDELADTYPDLTVWEMPALSRGYSLVRPYIDGGMRAGIPDLDVRRHTITPAFSGREAETMTPSAGAPDTRSLSTIRPAWLVITNCTNGAAQKVPDAGGSVSRWSPSMPRGTRRRHWRNIVRRTRCLRRPGS